MTAETITLAGRAAAEALMVDTCTIGTLEAATFDSGTGTFTPGTIDPVYTGKCRVQVVDSLNAQEPRVGERQLTIQQLVLSVPTAAAGIEVGQVVELLTAALDPELVGRRFRVVGTHAKSHATARRLQCEEVTR
jgi:hypothetical protein